ncbi:MAG TPA: PQQ-binding-like beta-propeller repeat protein [Vicinamibacterales bacterium]|jgi:outer membrane protein assembly factor BamB|nr:PQQ-binding-like beta-propeller repeat protein [Vicinamibacterales bacterium]
MRPSLAAAALCLVVHASASAGAEAEWPSFRGPAASGIADGQQIPDTWDVVSGKNVRWRTAIPGLAHSSPVVAGDRVFVTTAVSSRGGATFKPGLYGDGTASEDQSSHQWKVIALDRRNGRVLWERVAFEGVPREKRHIKATYANQTPATDGRYVVAFFGSQGIFAFDVDGRPMWQRDLGRLNAGAYDIPSYEWGNASSPIIYRDRVIVQCDTHETSFLMALDLKTGRTLWKTERKELPSWGTPTVYTAGGRPEIVTNASNFVRGYDPETGRELWRLGGSSKITAPTPIFTKDLVIVASGRAPERPIFAIRPGADGDLTLGEGQTSSGAVVWSKRGRGSYMPTPIAYQDHLYVVANQGLLDCYELATGREVYRERIPHRGSGFSASPVASDGRLFLPGEDGDIFVVRAGPAFGVIATNSMGELVMATPAIAHRTLFVRTERHLVAISQ